MSDGTARGTTVYDADGEPVRLKFTRIDWSIDARGVGEATLKIQIAGVDVVALGDGERGVGDFAGDDGRTRNAQQ